MNIDVVQEGIEYYKEAVGEGITPLMFLQCCGMLVVFLIIRFLLLLKIENVTLKCKEKEEKIKKYFLLSHITIEALIAFAVAYSIIVLRNSQTHNYIWNMIIAPGCGLIIAILIDLKFIMKNEADAPLSLSVYKSVKTKSESESKPTPTVPSNNLAPSINIQVNSGNGNMDTKSKKVEIESDLELKNENTKENLQEDEDMKTISINESKDETIKSIIDMQEQQAISLCKMSEIIDAMRENIVTNMRFELHDAMMECVTRGYATPTEYERITEKMHNYKSLKGNHGVDALYNEKFKNLPIK